MPIEANQLTEEYLLEQPIDFLVCSLLKVNSQRDALERECERLRGEVQRLESEAEEKRQMIKGQGELLERTCHKRDEYKQERDFALEDVAVLKNKNGSLHSVIVMAGKEIRDLRARLDGSGPQISVGKAAGVVMREQAYRDELLVKVGEAVKAECQKRANWISVKQELPPAKGRVVVWQWDTHQADFRRFDSVVLSLDYLERCCISHWMWAYTPDDECVSDIESEAIIEMVTTQPTGAAEREVDSE